MDRAISPFYVLHISRIITVRTLTRSYDTIQYYIIVSVAISITGPDDEKWNFVL